MKEKIKTFSVSIFYLLLAFIIQISIAIIYDIILVFYLMLKDDINIINSPDKLTNMLMENTIYIILISSIIIILSITLIYNLKNRKIKKEILLVKTKKINLFLPIFLGITLLCINIGVLGIIESSGFFIEEFRSFTEATNLLTTQPLLITILIAGIISPFAEEFLFRGVIYTTLLKNFSILPSILIQGIFFGIFHGNIIQGVYATLLGVILGYITYKTKSLYPAIIAHSANNIISLLISELLPQSLDTMLTYCLLLAIGIFITPLLITILNKNNDISKHYEMDSIRFYNL